MEKKITLFHGFRAWLLLHGKRGTGKGVGRFLFAGRFCKPLYSGYGISAGFTFEQPGLYHSQLDRRAGRASSIFHKNAGGKAGQAISDRQFQRERKCL